MTRFSSILVLSFLLSAGIQIACAQFSQIGPLDLDQAPSRQELLNRLYNERRLLVVYGAETSAETTQLREAIERSSWGRWRTNLTLQLASETTREDLQRSAILLIGNPSTNSFLQDLPSTLPLSFENDHFAFLGKPYTHNEDVVTLLYPNPHNDEYPLFIIAAFEVPPILNALNSRLRNLDYEVVRGEQRLRIGNFSQAEKTRWQPDPALDEDFEDDVMLVGTTDHFRFYAHNTAPDHALLSQIILAREQTVDRLKEFAGTHQTLDDPIRYFLYPSLEEKAIVTNNMEFAHVNGRQQTVHVALEDGIRGDHLNRESIVLLRKWIGRASIPALEDGLSIALSQDWFDESYETWMARIAHAGFTLTPQELLDEASYRNASPLLREPQAAAMVTCMIEDWGKDNFLEHYSEWKPRNSEWPALEYMWENCIDEHKSAFSAPVRTRKQNLHPPFQKGFNFAHEGYSIVDGYGSKAADAALEKLATMGVNAISIIPYTGMRDPHHPVPLRFANSANDENDGAVAHAARTSQRLGFTVMIKPQIWLRGSWPGDLDMQSEEEWDRFFNYYEHWISHYALLAELFEVDILCIGTELTHASMKHEERWIDMANRIRSVYSGQLVYASNWGEEFESLKFWDAFDYIGLNSYYPLSDKENATEAELRAGAQRVVKRIKSVQKRFNKPLLLTEIGFPSTDQPWILPFQENRQHPPNTDHQALCYQIMIEALSDEKWLGGIYWWKWPSYLERGGAETRDRFTPNGKPAARVVADWYLDR